jgi:YD repeat-containing protein
MIAEQKPPLRAIVAILLLSLSDAAAATYTYDTGGRLTKVDYGNGSVVTYGYDQAGNIVTRSVAQSTTPPPALFFTGEVSLGSGVEYLQFPDGNLFGYYNLTNFPIFYHYDMGFEAFVDGGSGAAYMYDFTSNHWFYTSPSLFPYLYDFTLNSWLYYFPDTKTPGHYTTNPRYFTNLATGNIFTL